MLIRWLQWDLCLALGFNGWNGNDGARQGWQRCMNVYISETQSLPLVLIFSDPLISLTFWLLVFCFFTITKTKRGNTKEMFFLLNKCSFLSLCLVPKEWIKLCWVYVFVIILFQILYSETDCWKLEIVICGSIFYKNCN